MEPADTKSAALRPAAGTEAALRPAAGTEAAGSGGAGDNHRRVQAALARLAAAARSQKANAQAGRATSSAREPENGATSPSHKPLNPGTTVARSSSAARPYLQDDAGPRRGEPATPLWRVVADLFLKLGVALGIGYLSLYALRGLMGRSGTLPARKGLLKVLESASLGPNRAVHLVRAGRHVMVIGSTAEQITRLSEFDDPDLLARVEEDGQPSFASHLNGILSRGAEPGAADPIHDGVRHLWGRIQEIRGLGDRAGGNSHGPLGDPGKRNPPSRGHDGNRS